MRKAAYCLAAGDVIVDRLPGLIEPVRKVRCADGFVDIGCPPGWQAFRLRADDVVDVEDREPETVDAVVRQPVADLLV